MLQDNSGSAYALGPVICDWPSYRDFMVIMFVLISCSFYENYHTLIYADDALLASHRKTHLEPAVQKWNGYLLQLILRLNLNKTDFLTTNHNEIGTVTVNGNDQPKKSD